MLATVADPAGMKVTQEPNYKNEPGYCLFALGLETPTNIWIVADGEELYVDLNANGDLTDDGGPLKVVEQQTLSSYRDADYEPIAIQAADGSDYGELRLGFYQTDSKPVNHIVKLLVDQTVQRYAGWRPMFSESTESASTYRFEGKFTIRQLRGKELSLSDEELELHLAFVIQEGGKSAKTSLAISAIAEDSVPVATIEWPSSKGSDKLPITSEVNLVHRC